MTGQNKLYLIIGLLLVAVILLIIIIKNTQKSNLKKDIDDLNVRFNAVKTIPLAFKLSKAQAMAKRSAETSDAVKVYYDKFIEAQKHIDQINEMMQGIEDEIAGRKFKDAREAVTIVKENIEDSEKEVADIDKFLEQFSEEENDQRESSAKLKEEFREIKLYIDKNPNSLSIAYDGIIKKVENIENLFSTSEEYMYINDYLNSQDCLVKIKDAIKDIKKCVVKIPELISDTKGVVPTLVDEVNRQYALTRQRGVYIKHLNIDKRLEEINKAINEDVKTLCNGEIGDVEKHNEELKAKLNELLSDLEKENKAYQDLKNVGDKIGENITNLKTLHNYVKVAYKKDKERFGIEDLDIYIDECENRINGYQADYIIFNQDCLANEKAATVLIEEANKMIEETNKDKTVLADYKVKFDKNTTDEKRAKSQLMKLQVVLNEVEVKVLEYHLPTIADSYHDDLIAGREKIATIKDLLNEVPINIDKLNETLDEAIDFIYKFYNNVNNVVGMAIMVENAIVFGNKYRSTYPEVERDLSKAEFSYINGEYTKALTMAISCMEKLFPNKKDNDYLENI